jgi:murein peptide amidase A
VLAGVAAASPGQATTGPVVLGRSVHGRPILLVRRGASDAGERILVVGCIHGNECAGKAVVQWLEHAALARGLRLWLVENLNPDGYAAGTRQNEHGVDLNRNFPWHWRPLDRQGGLNYSGPHALSEPEARLVASLIERVRPDVTIWFHQPLAVVDQSGGSVALERRYAHLVGLPLVRLPRYPGSAAGWQNHLYPNTSFVVELAAGPLGATAVARFGNGVLDLLGAH